LGQGSAQNGDEGVRVPERVPWGIADGLFVVVAFILVQTAVWKLLVLLTSNPRPHIAVGFLSDLLIFGLAYGIVRVREGGGRSVTRLLGLRKPRPEWVGSAVRAVLAGAAGFVGARVATTVALEFLRIDWRQLPAQQISEVVRGAEGLRVVAGASLLAVVVAPVAEETIFRSVLYLPLRQRLGPVAAGLVVAVLFSAGHGYLLGAAQLFVLSLVFSALFERSGSLWVPIAAHAAFNGVNIALLLLLRFLVSG